MTSRRLRTGGSAVVIDPEGSASVRVLVVDDDRSNLVLLERLLAALGFSDVQGETDVSALLDTITAFDPGLILLDRHLGRTDALDVVQRLAADDPRWGTRRVLLITGDTETETRRRARAVGVRDILYKPFELRELHWRIERVLKGVPPFVTERPE